MPISNKGIKLEPTAILCGWDYTSNHAGYMTAKVKMHP
jgi:hypothetical protein